MATSNWRDVRARANLDEANVAAHRERMSGEVRAARLADVRRSHSVSQTQLANHIGVSQARVSAIENGELSSTEVSTLTKYIEGLGGRLQIIADFGDEKLALS